MSCVHRTNPPTLSTCLINSVRTCLHSGSSYAINTAPSHFASSPPYDLITAPISRSHRSPGDDGRGALMASKTEGTEADDGEVEELVSGVTSMVALEREEGRRAAQSGTIRKEVSITTYWMKPLASSQTSHSGSRQKHRY